LWYRNTEWHDNEILYEVTLEKNPDVHIFRQRLGEIYMDAGRMAEAKAEFEYLTMNALDWRDIGIAYKYLGEYYLIQDDKETALEYYIKSTQTRDSPRNYMPNNVAGTLYLEQGNYLQAFSYFCRSLQLFPTEIAQSNLDAASRFIEAEHIEAGTLHKNIVAEFEKSPLNSIVYIGQQCAEGGCQYAFGVQSESIETLSPFLITVTNEKDGFDIELEERSYDAERRIITLQISDKYEDETLSFVFPTCTARYYEVKTAQQP